MLRFILQRALYALPLILVIIVVMFTLLHLIPGDPVQALVGDYPVPPAYRQAIEEKYRLNDPFLTQVWNYVTAVLQGDFGFSYQNQRPVLGLILERAPRTILLASVGFAFAIPLGMAIGVITGTTRSATTDKVWTTSALIAYAIPTFWLGQLLVMFLPCASAGFPPRELGRSYPAHMASTGCWNGDGIWPCRLWPSPSMRECGSHASCGQA
jgi:peptide/nickel transport system permease protein